MLEQILAWPGRGLAPEAAARLEAARLGLLLHALAVAASWTGRQTPLEPPMALRLACVAALLGCLGVAALRPSWGRAATGAAAVLAWLQVLLRFPASANHEFLGAAALTFVVALEGDSEPERALALDGLRWLLVLVLVWAGLQKVLAGTWFGGEFLAFEVATESRFRVALRRVLGAQEAGRLAGLGGWREGAGPYRFEGWRGILLSNGAWLAELILPLGLCLPRWRRVACVGLAVFLACVELGAREWLFAGLVIQISALFWGRAPRRGFGLGLALLYGGYVLARLFIETRR